jgi:hypothetical protein
MIVELRAIDIDSPDIQRRCRCDRDFAAYRVLTGGTPPVLLLCHDCAYAERDAVKRPWCTCGHSVTFHKGLKPCAKPDCDCPRWVIAAADGKPLWLADGGNYD